MQRMSTGGSASGLTRVRLAAVVLLCGYFGWFALAENHEVATLPTKAEDYFFHHDHIIGTSLDLWLAAPDEAAAAAAEQAILNEIERLRRIFSTYDPQSEISRLNRTAQPCATSPEMLEVLRAYEVWQRRSHGAFNGQLGELVRA